MTDSNELNAQSLGGKARAAKLTPEQRSAIASAAAESRWKNRADLEGIARLPKATHTGSLTMGDASISCAVLENGRRVLTQRGMFVALGRNKNPSAGHTTTIDGRPGFLSAANLSEFITEDLRRSWDPIPFRLPKGPGGFKGNIAFGYDASLLPQICNLFVDAKIAGKTTSQQEHVVTACRRLLKGLAGVAIIALVDEATGYQYDRAKDELSKILAAYISPKLLPWTQRFPHEFFQQVYRLHGWEYKPGTVKHPQYLGKFINKYVYDALPPGVLEEMKRKLPKNENGNRPAKLWQTLTIDTGVPHLDRQLIADETLMQVSKDKREFDHHWQGIFGKQRQLLLAPAKEFEA
jgi:P63C domain